MTHKDTERQVLSNHYESVPYRVRELVGVKQ